MKKFIAALVLLTGLAAAAILADQAAERDQEYRRLIIQGDDALSRGETFVAIEAYSGAVALKRGSMEAYLKRGEAHLRRGDTPELLSAALRDLRTAHELDPGATRTLERLGDVNVQLGRFANAAEHYEAYIALDDHSPTIFYKLGLASRGDGRLTRAVSALQQAVALKPDFHEAHYALGLCLKDRDELVEARAAFERAIALSPAFIPAREELADLHRLQNETRDELEQLNALFALDPAKPERLIAVGLAHQRAGNHELAVVTLRRAGELFPDYPGVYAAVGQVWLETAEDSGEPSDWRKAIEALEPIATQTTASSETLGHFGRALVLAGQYARAESMFRQAAQRFPIEPDVLPHLATVSERLGRLDDARPALVKYSVLVDDAREGASHAKRIGDLSIKLNDPVSAAVWYRRSEALDPSDTSVLVRLADAQAKAGQLDQARSTAARALEADPENAAARALARRLQVR